MFLLLAIAFLLGFGAGVVAGVWQKDINELDDFKRKNNL